MPAKNGPAVRPGDDKYDEEGDPMSIEYSESPGTASLSSHFPLSKENRCHEQMHAHLDASAAHVLEDKKDPTTGSTYDLIAAADAFGGLGAHVNDVLEGGFALSRFRLERVKADFMHEAEDREKGKR